VSRELAPGRAAPALPAWRHRRVLRWRGRRTRSRTREDEGLLGAPHCRAFVDIVTGQIMRVSDRLKPHSSPMRWPAMARRSP